MSSQQLNGIIGGKKIFETDLLAKKIFYLAINSSIIKTPSGYAARQESFCTAIALHPQVILTAAHCVENILPENINLIEGISPWLSVLKPELWHQTTQILIHPKYKKKKPEYDLALLQLQVALPLGSTIGLHNLSPENQLILLTGFGFRIANMGSGNDNSTENSDILKYNSGELYYAPKILKKYSSDELTFSFESSASETVCIGDSGGPALVHNEETLTFTAVGLLSGSVEFANSQNDAQFVDQDFCSGTPVYNNLRHPEIRSWIDGSLNQLLLAN